MPQALPLLKVNIRLQLKHSNWGRLFLRCSKVHHFPLWRAAIIEFQPRDHHKSLSIKKYKEVPVKMSGNAFQSAPPRRHLTPQVTFNLLLVSNYDCWQILLAKREPSEQGLPHNRWADEAHLLICFKEDLHLTVFRPGIDLHYSVWPIYAIWINIPFFQTHKSVEACSENRLQLYWQLLYQDTDYPPCLTKYLAALCKEFSFWRDCLVHDSMLSHLLNFKPVQLIILLQCRKRALKQFPGNAAEANKSWIKKNKKKQTNPE